MDSDAILRSHEDLFPLPDVVFFIDVPPEAALLRVEARGEEKNESYEKLGFLQDVAKLFRSFERDYICPIPGEGSPETVHQAVLAQLTARPGLPRL